MDPHDRTGSLVRQTSGQSESPFAYELWCRDNYVELSHRDVEAINSAAFESVERAGNKTVDYQPNPKVSENDGCTHSSSSGSGAPTVSRRRKKPKGFPKRPLSGYNIFFKEERVKVLHEFSSRQLGLTANGVHALGTKSDRSSVSFQELGKIVGKRWKILIDEDRRKFEDLADQDNLRYRSEMDVYNESKRKRNEEKCQKSIVDDIDDTKHPLNSTWNSMVLSYPSGMHPSFQPFTRSAPPEQTWQLTEQDQRNSSSIRMEDAFSYPIPPGTELVLPDQRGIDRYYQVQYNFYKMKRSDAEAYMTQLAQTSTVTPYGFTDYPPPPPSATDVQHPYWYG